VLLLGHSGENCRSKSVSRVLVDASASGRPSNCCNNSAGAAPQGCIGQLACRAFRRLWLSRNTCAKMRDPKNSCGEFLGGGSSLSRGPYSRSKRPSRRSEDVHPVRLPLLLPRSVVGPKCDKRALSICRPGYPPITDIARRGWHGRNVPGSDICTAANRTTIRSARRRGTSTLEGRPCVRSLVVMQQVPSLLLMQQVPSLLLMQQVRSLRPGDVLRGRTHRAGKHAANICQLPHTATT
jgi:hypothetical protein